MSSTSRRASDSRSCILQALRNDFSSFLDGGRYLGYEDEGFNVHDVRTGKRVQQFGKPGVYALSPDGQYLATRSNTEQKLKITRPPNRPGSQGPGHR